MRTSNIAEKTTTIKPTASISPEVQSLIWTQLDGTMSSGQSKMLRGILERSKSARQAYVDAVEEHFGIANMFRRAAE